MKPAIFPLSLSFAVVLGISACSQRPSPEAQPAPAPAPPAAVAEADAASAAEARSAQVRDRVQKQQELVSRLEREPSQGMAQKRALAAYSPMVAMPAPQADRERYAAIERNGITVASEQPVSTFSIDVDTGSYANVRRFLANGQLPPSDAVRVEELLNYFDYGYAPPRGAQGPFAVSTRLAPTPWNPDTLLLQVGVQTAAPVERPRASNLVFLVDVSGSMQAEDKLPLVKQALSMLVRELGRDDRISLVVYAGASGVVLEPTPGNRPEVILAALDRLEAGGSTNGGAGIELAYAMARAGYVDGGTNRVILATDGDFNVGITRFESLLDRVRREQDSGIALTTLGFGQGNYNDQLMEQLADAGEGNHAYIDSVREAHKVLVRQRHATLETLARDVKLQLEFNPSQVAEYRLIGYENRKLAREDFANDAVDAGEIGPGHTVTALYEIALVGSGGERVQPLRYGQAPLPDTASSELAHLRIRYQPPGQGTAASKLIEHPVTPDMRASSLAEAGEGMRLSAAVAAFGQLLAGSEYLQGFDYTAVARLAAGLPDDAYGDRAEFRALVDSAAALTRQAGIGGQTIGG